MPKASRLRHAMVAREESSRYDTIVMIQISVFVCREGSVGNDSSWMRTRGDGLAKDGNRGTADLISDVDAHRIHREGTTVSSSSAKQKQQTSNKLPAHILHEQPLAIWTHFWLLDKARCSSRAKISVRQRMQRGAAKCEEVD